MINIVFIGAHPTNQLVQTEKRIDSLYRDSEAVISGLRCQEEVNLHVITSPDIRSFPHAKLYYKSFFDEEDDTLVVSSLNLPIIKQLWTVVSMCFAASRIIGKDKKPYTVILPYMVFRHVMVGRLLRFVFGARVKVCLIVPDIFFPKKKYLQLYYGLAENAAKCFDYFVFYTEAMRTYLGLEDKKYIVIEGFHDIQKKDIVSPRDCFVLTYAGTLSTRYGVLRLLDAFRLLPQSDIRLHLYGSGDGVDLINQRSEEDNRICYFGRVSKSEAMEALRHSSALINPRNAEDGEYVQYSFPSKDIDYMATGLPSIMCKLPGMPQSYYGKFIDAGTGSPEDLAQAIMQVYNMTQEERRQFGDLSYSFIKEQMDITKQGKKIVTLIQL
jgi:glycosyltransferase involved in cell wall biosynthesis